MKTVTIAGNDAQQGFKKPIKKSNYAVFILTILAWMLFVGLCFDVGALMVSSTIVLLKPDLTQYVWQNIDLSGLLKHSRQYYLNEVIIMSIVGILKAYLFYLILAILHNNKIKIDNPFHVDVKRFVQRSACITLLIGIFSYTGSKYTLWLRHQNIAVPQVEDLSLGGADVWVFMSVILFVIATIFKKGIELQQENELTV